MATKFLYVLNEDFRELKDALQNLNTRKSRARENSRFSSLLAAGDVSRGGTSRLSDKNSILMT